MYLEIMTTMLYKCIDYLFPISGGLGGGALMGKTIHSVTVEPDMVWMSWEAYVQAIIMIVVGGLIGAFLGWIVKRWLDKLFPKKKKS